MKRALALTVAVGMTASAQPPDDSLTVHAIGRRTLAAIDSIRYEPTSEPLTGTFFPAYSGTSEPFIAAVLKQLAALYPGVDWDSQNQFTSSPGVIWYILNGSNTLGISSLQMTSAEREEFERRFGHPVLEARVALDALQIVVHPNNPIPSITVPELDAVYGTELRAGAQEVIRDWSDLPGAGSGPIHPYSGSLHYGTSRCFRHLVLEDGPWSDNVQTLGCATFGPAESVSKDPLGIGFCNVAPRGPSVRVLPVARQTGERAYLPLPAHIYGEEYPLVRFFYLYVNASDARSIPPVEREFLRYLLSLEGQHEVAKTGALPLDVPMLVRARKRLGLSP